MNYQLAGVYSCSLKTVDPNNEVFLAAVMFKGDLDTIVQTYNKDTVPQPLMRVTNEEGQLYGSLVEVPVFISSGIYSYYDNETYLFVAFSYRRMITDFTIAAFLEKARVQPLEWNEESARTFLEAMNLISLHGK